MKTFTAIREDLKNIRYYYARRDEMAQKAKILGECTVSKPRKNITKRFVKHRQNFTNCTIVCTSKTIHKNLQPTNMVMQENTSQDLTGNCWFFFRTILRHKENEYGRIYPGFYIAGRQRI